MLDNLYTNVGDKLCTVAKVCGFIGVVAAAIGLGATFLGIVVDDDLLYTGIPALVSGLLSLISSWPLYAFGQITNDIQEMKKNVSGKPTAKPASTLPELPDLPEL